MNTPSLIPAWTIRFDHKALSGFEVCWAGPRPGFMSGFSFGSLDGRFITTTPTGAPLGVRSNRSRSGEAINGAAWAHNTLVLGTRSDLTFYKNQNSKRPETAVVAVGVHSLLATPSGIILGSAGEDGIVSVNTRTGEVLVQPLRGPDDTSFGYAYATSLSGSIAGGEQIVVAGRATGLFLTSVNKWGKFGPIRAAVHEQTDYIDAVSVSSQKSGRTVVAIGRSGAMAVFRDNHSKQPGYFSKLELDGAVYRAFLCQGHLCILTDRRLYFVYDFAVMMNSFSSESSLSFSSIVTNAIDASVAYGRYILLVTDENTVAVIDIKNIELSRTGQQPLKNIRDERMATNVERWTVQKTRTSSSRAYELV